MNPTIVAGLLATFGPSVINLVTQLIALEESKTNVSSEQWTTMIADIKASTAQSEMAKQLAAAGISPTDPRYLALIAVTKPA